MCPHAVFAIQESERLFELSGEWSLTFLEKNLADSVVLCGLLLMPAERRCPDSCANHSNHKQRVSFSALEAIKYTLWFYGVHAFTELSQ
jgi:hypothetical protein